MSEPNLFISKKENYPEGNFLTISKQITQYRKEDGELLSSQAIALFFRLLCTPPNYVFKLQDAKTKFGLTRDAARSAINELQEAGFVKREDIRNELGYTLINIYVRECLDLNFLESRVQNPISEIGYRESSTGKPISEIGDPYINKYVESNNKQLNILQKNINNYLPPTFPSEKIGTQNSLNNSNIGSIDSSHVSHTPATSSLKLPNVSKQDVALDNNQDKIKNIMSVTDPKNEVKEKPKRGGDRVKNAVQRMEQEKGDSIHTVDTQIANTMDNLTDEDNRLSNMIRIAKELESTEKAINKSNIKKLTNKKQMQKYVEKLITDIEVCDKFKDYLDVKIEKTGPMSKKSLEILVEDFIRTSNNDKSLMLAMLREATKKGWGDLYLNENIEKQAAQFNTVQKMEENNTEEINDDDFAVIDLFDENGNKIKF